MAYNSVVEKLAGLKTEVLETMGSLYEEHHVRLVEQMERQRFEDNLSKVLKNPVKNGHLAKFVAWDFAREQWMRNAIEDEVEFWRHFEDVLYCVCMSVGGFANDLDSLQAELEPSDPLLQMLKDLKVAADYITDIAMELESTATATKSSVDPQMTDTAFFSRMRQNDRQLDVLMVQLQHMAELMDKLFHMTSNF